MAGFDGIDPMDLAEMTETELANKLTADEIVRGKHHFKDPKARQIAHLKVINRVSKLCNEILDDAMPKPKKMVFIYITRSITKSMKKIVIMLCILIIVSVIGLHFVFASEDMPYSYKIVLNHDEHEGLLGNGEDTIRSIDIFVDGKRLEGLLSDSPSCVTGSQYVTSCEIAQILQNEKIIEQNDKIISLLKELRK